MNEPGTSGDESFGRGLSTSYSSMISRSEDQFDESSIDLESENDDNSDIISLDGPLPLNKVVDETQQRLGRSMGDLRSSTAGAKVLRKNFSRSFNLKPTETHAFRNREIGVSSHVPISSGSNGDLGKFNIPKKKAKSASQILSTLETRYLTGNAQTNHWENKDQNNSSAPSQVVGTRQRQESPVPIIRRKLATASNNTKLLDADSGLSPQVNVTKTRCQSVSLSPRQMEKHSAQSTDWISMSTSAIGIQNGLLSLPLPLTRPSGSPKTSTRKMPVDIHECSTAGRTDFGTGSAPAPNHGPSGDVSSSLLDLVKDLESKLLQEKERGEQLVAENRVLSNQLKQIEVRAQETDCRLKASLDEVSRLKNAIQELGQNSTHSDASLESLESDA